MNFILFQIACHRHCHERAWRGHRRERVCNRRRRKGACRRPRATKRELAAANAAAVARELAATTATDAREHVANAVGMKFFRRCCRDGARRCCHRHHKWACQISLSSPLQRDRMASPPQQKGIHHRRHSDESARRRRREGVRRQDKNGEHWTLERLVAELVQRRSESAWAPQWRNVGGRCLVTNTSGGRRRLPAARGSGAAPGAVRHGREAARQAGAYRARLRHSVTTQWPERHSSESSRRRRRQLSFRPPPLSQAVSAQLIYVLHTRWSPQQFLFKQGILHRHAYPVTTFLILLQRPLPALSRAQATVPCFVLGKRCRCGGSKLNCDRIATGASRRVYCRCPCPRPPVWRRRTVGARSVPGFLFV